MKRLPSRRQNICGVYVRAARKSYAIRHHQKMTQADLAAKLQLKGLTDFERVCVCRIERGVRQVSDVELKYLAAALDVSVHYLLYGVEHEPPQLPRFADMASVVAECDERQL